MNKPSDFYVYVLFRPWNGVPCYVGKGRGRRYTQHARAGDTHRNKILARIFARSNRLNLEVPCVIVRNHLNEDDAYSVEIALIKALGRRDNGTGYLANLTDGGEGLSGIERTPHTRKLLSKSMTNRMSKLTPDELSAHATKASMAARDVSAWINDGTTDRRIRSCDPIPEGWKRGRLNVASGPAFTLAAAGTIWVNNGMETKRIGSDIPIPSGWVHGRPKPQSDAQQCLFDDLPFKCK